MTTNGINRKWPDVLAQLFVDHQNWNAAQFQRQLVIIFGKSKAPGLSAVQKRLPAVRLRFNSLMKARLDAPWRMHDTLDMAAEAIAHVLEVQKGQYGLTRVFWGASDGPSVDFIQHGLVIPYNHIILADEESNAEAMIESGHAVRYELTIRQAKWIARLYAVTSLKETRTLFLASLAYATTEFYAEFEDVPLDTATLDAVITFGLSIEKGLRTYLRGYNDIHSNLNRPM